MKVPTIFQRIATLQDIIAEINAGGTVFDTAAQIAGYYAYDAAATADAGGAKDPAAATDASIDAQLEFLQEFGAQISHGVLSEALGIAKAWREHDLAAA